MKKQLWFFILIIGILLCLTGCGGKEKEACENIIKEFEVSWAQRDIDGVIDCIDPTIAGYINLGTAIVGNTSGMSKDEIFEQATDYLNLNFGEGSTKAIEDFKIDIKKTKVKGEIANVLGKASFSSFDVKITKEVLFNLIKTNDKWYISGFEIVG